MAQLFPEAAPGCMYRCFFCRLGSNFCANAFDAPKGGGSRAAAGISLLQLHRVLRFVGHKAAAVFVEGGLDGGVVVLWFVPRRLGAIGVFKMSFGPAGFWRAY